jgi:hypothetical protein
VIGFLLRSRLVSFFTISSFSLVGSDTRAAPGASPAPAPAPAGFLAAGRLQHARKVKPRTTAHAHEALRAGGRSKDRTTWAGQWRILERAVGVHRRCWRSTRKRASKKESEPYERRRRSGRLHPISSMGLRFCTCAGRLNAAEEEKHDGCRTAGEGYALLRPTNELVPTRQHSGADGLASRCRETVLISLAQGNTKRNKIFSF